MADPTYEELQQALKAYDQKFALQTAAFQTVIQNYSTLSDKVSKWYDERMALEFGTANGGPNGDGLYPITGPDNVIRMFKSDERAELDRAKLSVVNLTGAGNYTLGEEHSGKTVNISNGNANIFVTIPATVSVGWACMVTQYGTGPLYFRIGQGGTLRSDQSFTRTRGSYSVASLMCTAKNQAGLAIVFLTGGLTAE